MSNINDGGLVFPSSRYERLANIAGVTEYINVTYPGMSLRDWFAGQALAGLVQLMPSRIGFDEQVASVSYRVADAMIAEREKGGAK